MFTQVRGPRITNTAVATPLCTPFRYVVRYENMFAFSSFSKFRVTAVKLDICWFSWMSNWPDILDNDFNDIILRRVRFQSISVNFEWFWPFLVEILVRQYGTKKTKNIKGTKESFLYLLTTRFGISIILFKTEPFKNYLVMKQNNKLHST